MIVDLRDLVDFFQLSEAYNFLVPSLMTSFVILSRCIL